MCRLHAGTCRAQESVCGPLELALWVAVRHCVGAGNQTGGLWQERQVLLTARLLFVPPTNYLSWEFLVCSSAVSVPQWQSQPPPWGLCICWVVLSWSPSSGYRGNICAATRVTSVQQLLPPPMKLKQGWSSSWVKVKGHFRQSSRGLGSVLGGD